MESTNNNFKRELSLLRFQFLCAFFDRTRIWAEAELGQSWHEHQDIVSAKNAIKNEKAYFMSLA